MREEIGLKSVFPESSHQYTGRWEWARPQPAGLRAEITQKMKKKTFKNKSNFYAYKCQPSQEKAF